MAESMPEIRMQVDRSPLRIGSDTLADAFGDFIYLVCRRGEVECPVCGKWCHDAHGRFQCDCGAQFAAKLSGRWAAIRTDELIHLADQFFLPRAWNKEPPYITSAALRALYDTFKQEREECKTTLEIGRAE